MSGTRGGPPARFQDTGPALLRAQIGAPPFPTERGRCVMCAKPCDPSVWICPACRPEAERQRVAEESTAWMKRFQAAVRAARATIPKRFADMTFEHELLRGIRQADIARLKNAPGDVTLIGKSGVRKTCLATALLAHILTKGEADPRGAAGALARGAVFALAAEVSKTRQFGDAPRPFGVDAAEIIEAERATVLVLDDVGSEGSDRSRIDAISEIYQIRHQDERPTITTTWLYPNEAATRYGGGIARRLFDEATATVIWVDPDERVAWQRSQERPRLEEQGKR